MSVLCDAAPDHAASGSGWGHGASQPQGSPLLASIKGLLFYLWTLALAVPLFVAMLFIYPFVMLLDRHRRAAQHWVNNIWARATTTPFYGVQDIFTLFHLGRSFKFVSKRSIFLFPIVGWSMFLTGHIMLNRMDTRSQMACLRECQRLLGLGVSVLFFPEGTRSTDGKMAAFKKGAFSVAAKAKVPVVPITLIGTGALMPNKQESKVYNGQTRIVVHPPVQPTDADSMLRQSREAISSSLPPDLVNPQVHDKTV